MPKKLTFEVIHVSGSDEGFSAKELEIHSPTTRGWQSLRFCEYPQEIIFALKEVSNVTKIQILSHQHNIASKVEVFVGVPSSPTSTSKTLLRDCHFTRLGYVHLSPNEESNFQARELKSVLINKDGLFVKLLIHKNYVNKLNLYNQVCLVAINILGFPLSKNFGNEPLYNRNTKDGVLDYFMNQANKTDDQLNTNPLNIFRFDENQRHISPYDDLSFDMYQDPETAQLIRKLDDKKRVAIMEERYDYAKKLKDAISDLHKIGEKLGKFEVEKRRAVEAEDFDIAKKKKIQSDEYRLQVYKQLDIHALLELPEVHRAVLSPKKIEGQVRNNKLNNNNNNSDRTKKPETKLPHVVQSSSTKTNIIQEKTSQVEPMPDLVVQQNQQKNSDEGYELSAKTSNTSSNLNDDRPLPSLQKKQSSEDSLDQLDPYGENLDVIELKPLTEQEEREGELIIEIFGMNTAQMVYSKSWKYRQDSMVSLIKKIDEAQNEGGENEEKSPKEVSRALVNVLTKTLNDKIFQVLFESIGLLKQLLENYIPKKGLGKTETSYVIEKLIPLLMKRMGNVTPRMESLISNAVVEIANLSQVKGNPSMTNIVTDLSKSKTPPPWKLLKNQINLLNRLISDLGLDTSAGGLSTERVMRVLLNALEHPNSKVRDEAVACIVKVYEIVREPLKSYLPADDSTSRRNPLYVKLFDSLDRADGKPTQSERKLAERREKENHEKSKEEEVKVLKAQLDQMKQLAQEQIGQQLQQAQQQQKQHGQQPQTASGDGNDSLSKSRKEKSPPANAKKSQRMQSRISVRSHRPISQRKRDSQQMIDKMCIFCGELSEKFDDDGLDLHYWKNCPMLKRCEACTQVVEISCISDHLLSECDMKTNYMQCNKCGLAIHKNTQEQHRNASSCKPVTDSTKIACPLCGTVLQQDTEETWKFHLVEKCRVNIQRIKKEAPAAGTKKSVGRGRSQIPKSRGGRGSRGK